MPRHVPGQTIHNRNAAAENTHRWPHRPDRLVPAVKGVRAAWRDDGGFRNQALGSLAMVTVLAVLQPAPFWWALALFASLLTLALELANCAIEDLLDEIAPEFDPVVGKIKNLAAAAVVTASGGVFAVGVLMVFDTLELLW